MAVTSSDQSRAHTGANREGNMRYVRVEAAGRERSGSYGVVEGETVFLLDGSPLTGARKRTGVSFPLSEVSRFLPPVEPPNIIALGLNYREHAAETGAVPPAEPVIFLKATTALIGHRQPVVLPREAPHEVDYEAELAVIIGKTAKNVSREEAKECIFGYTCANDVSARDCQMRRDRQWARAKSFDTFCPLGPWVDTDLDPSCLSVRCLLNGKTMQEGSTSDMILDVPSVVSFLSRQMTLLPGTCILTGTPPGVGWVRRPPVFLRAGDIVEVEIEGIGTLSNPVVADKEI